MTQPPYDRQPGADPGPGPQQPPQPETPPEGIRYGLGDEPPPEGIRYGLDGEPPPAGIRYGLDDEPSGAQYGPAGPPPPPPAGGFTVPGYAVPNPMAAPPQGTFDSWMRGTVALCRRSAGPVLAVLAITSVPPVLLTSIVYGLMLPGLDDSMITDPNTATTHDLVRFYTALAGVLGVLMLVSVAASYLSSVGWVAALRLMATDAAGRPRDIRAALVFGLRRGLALWGWYILAYLCVAVGTCFCVVPGIYLALALSMIAPITVFERGVPAFSRSFRLVHGNFWPAVGRLMVLALVVGAYAMILSCVLNLATGASSLDTTTTSTATMPGTGQIVVTSIIQAVLSLPATLVGIAGIFGVYVELRSRETGAPGYGPGGPEPVSAASLADSAR